MIDIRQSSEYSRYINNLGWEVVSVNGINCFIKRIPLFGLKIIKIQRSSKLLSLEKILDLVKKTRAVAVYIEPVNNKHYNYYIDHGFKLSKSPLLPSKTVQISITQKEEKLLSQMHYKTRYNIKLALRLGVKIKKSKRIDKFSRFWQNNALKRGMFLPMNREINAIYNAFGKKATILSAFYKDEKVAAIMLVDTMDTTYYMYATATDNGKKVFAPTLLVWHALMLAKKRKRKIFDFEGIFDERFPIKSWKGFSRFKKNFGGIEVEYPGTLRKYFLPF